MYKLRFTLKTYRILLLNVSLFIKCLKEFVDIILTSGV